MERKLPMSNPDQAEDEIEEILELLSEEELRIGEVADAKDMEFTEAQDLVHGLWDRNLVVSGPQFKFEADPEEPPTVE